MLTLQRNGVKLDRVSVMRPVDLAETPVVSSLKRKLGVPHARAVDVVHSNELSYRDFLQRFVRGNRPVVISDAVTEWSALRKWTPEYFRHRFGDDVIQVSYDKRMRMSDFVDAVLASSPEHPGPYLYRLFLHEHMPALLPDLIPQNIYGFPSRYASPLMPERWRRPDGYLKLLMGGPGSSFPVMHYDLEHANAVITQIYGAKEFYLFPPQDTPKVYPQPGQANWSQVKRPHDPDLQRFPLMAETTPHTTVLKPGQSIFIPTGWWHAARPLSLSISVATNAVERSNWRGFVGDVCATSKGRLLKPLFKRAYFTVSGALMGMMEDLQVALPAVARALVLPAKISPASADFMPEPSARPMHFRIAVD